MIRQANPDDAAGIVAHMRIISALAFNGTLWTPGEYQRTADDQRAMMTDYRDYRQWYVADCDSQVIGLVSAGSGTRIAERHTFGIGISVVPEWQDQGVGTALMQRIIDWGKVNLRVHRLELEVFVNNERAIHVYEKLGFVLEGRKKDAFFKDGQFRDTLLMAIIIEH